MKNNVTSPHYLRIARDIAFRIANGEFEEGQKIYGRSTMAAEYNTSPETIRRSMKLLADMKIVEVRAQSGVLVLSKNNAEHYISNFEETFSVTSLLLQLQEVQKEYKKLNDKAVGIVNEIVRSRYSFAAADDPLPNFEVVIPKGSALSGKSIGELRFWQATGATIVAIRRGKHVILSPGPYAELYEGDAVTFVGTPAVSEAVSRFVTESEESQLLQREN